MRRREGAGGGAGGDAVDGRRGEAGRADPERDGRCACHGKGEIEARLGCGAARGARRFVRDGLGYAELWLVRAAV